MFKIINNINGGKMSNLEKLTEQLSQLSLLDASKLISILEKKWGVKAQINTSSTNQNNITKNENNSQKSEFNVELFNIGPKKIQVIKAVREITGLGLKDAKEIVDQAPKNIKTGISKDEAESIKRKLEEHGASIKIS